MFCNNCGTQNPDTSQFCSKCGNRLTPAEPPPAYQPAQQPFQAPVRKTNGMAIAALVLGIASYIVGITSIPAIILGAVSLNQIKKDPTQDGKGMAIAGIVLGSVFIVLSILILIGLVAWAATTTYDSDYWVRMASLIPAV